MEHKLGYHRVNLSMPKAWLENQLANDEMPHSMSEHGHVGIDLGQSGNLLQCIFFVREILVWRQYRELLYYPNRGLQAKDEQSRDLEEPYEFATSSSHDAIFRSSR